MPAHSLNRIVGWLRSLNAGRPEGTDSELLHAYAARRDESAFTELMRRHSGLVWGVCRRCLAREQDAEDAFQATFLVLSRKAESIRAGKSLPSWLFGVARRSALLIRERSNRPVPQREPIPAPDPADEAAAAETCAIILDEVRRLPEKHRLPLLLCGLEGLTKAEAAQRLGWKEGTVSGRLGRARQQLRRRLERRGLLATAGIIPTLATTVPGRLFAATLQAAREIAVTRPLTPLPFPAVLAQEVIGSMRLTTRTLLVSVLVGGLLVLAAAGAVYYKTVTAAVPVAAEPPEADPASPRWQERLRLRGYLGGTYREFTPDGRLMATIDGRHVLRFLDTTTWQERARCELTKDPDGSYYPQWQPFSPDGKLFVLWWRVPGKGKGAKPLVETWLIEVATGKVRHVLAGSHPEFIPASKLLALRRGNDLVLWDYAAAAEVRTLAGMPVGWLKCSSPDGKFLYVPTTGGSGKLWEVETGKEIATLEGFNAVWAKDGKSLATVQPGPVVKLWDLPTGKLRATLQGFNQPGCLVEFSPDGRLLLTSVSEYGLKPDGGIEMPATLGKPSRPKRRPLDVRLWDAATGRELLRLPGDIQLCRSGNFSPDGKTIAYQRLTDDPGNLMEAVLWDVAVGKERLVLRTKDGLDGLLFSPDGSVLFGHAGPYGRTSMRLWDRATGRPLPSVPGTRNLRHHPGIRFSPDGKILTLDFVVPGGAVGKPVPEELQIYQWAAAPLTAETRGEPFVPEPQKEEPPKPSSAAAKAYEALMHDLESAERGFTEKFTAAKSEKDRQSVQRERILALEGFTTRALEIVRKDPQDPAAVDALEFAVRTTAGMSGKLGELGRTAIEQVRRAYLDSLTLDRFLHWIATHQTKAADELLRAALERSPHRTIRGRAGYQLAHSLADRADAARLLRQLPELANHPFLKDQAESLAFLRGIDPEATARQAESIYERLLKDYADVTQYDSQPVPLGEVAERGLFALRNLAVGKTAPDIDGADLDGWKFRLSDYRGKVVLLVFCGYWCGPCRAMNPHKQAMIRRYGGKPFTILEANSDEDPGEWKRVMKKEGYTWRCWADGRDGPIAKKWDVSRWPTVFVLDRQGVIRYKGLPSEMFEKALDALLGEATAN
jgi:RNA polymerase sigma factor (sigma-70 family)